ncbi:4Fe-4S dicluster domain-containing protein [Eggerthella sp. NSJ-70]|uniref:Fumarate reductase iron-sulfur subunit n=1 Tax=Eggerthella hominis TaxID=2763043 RepID=A0ABR7BTZ5_9ACTN|nr:2Fe-2S iron-sulfur cluster-binding protein [Eggerthella hominis]MBC5585086.1 4Fe-4S dicluster domain-containing protein [Eggerthella hominis]
MAEPITLNVQRFDPSTDAEPYVVAYEVPVDGTAANEVWTVLKALHYIHRNVEPITYDYNCRWGGCGRCGVAVDGVPKLACWARVEPGKSYRVEPLAGFPIVKDLMVDNARAYDRFVQSDLSIKTYRPMDEVRALDADVWWGKADGSDDAVSLKRFNRCRECMSCYTVCTALNDMNRWDSFIGPGAMMQIAARYLDTEDQSDRLSQAVFSGVSQCMHCGNCTSVCPAHIDIEAVNRKLLDDAVARGLIDGKEAATPSYPLL